MIYHFTRSLIKKKENQMKNKKLPVSYRNDSHLLNDPKRRAKFGERDKCYSFLDTVDYILLIFRFRCNGDVFDKADVIKKMHQVDFD